ncbi:hypothetical protein QR680_009971 [Steinernema hermaphroditum]|uniref:Uncharacterized protein n=1 Tax=Steinernema hermaphroditum TaxID=289476 RepID=A0AA39INM3_9BILA|nr:hypothetical protein QR680_009971 [Steinernema hermaphroditum]
MTTCYPMRVQYAPVFRRINMNHGLMRSIVRNQIERDEYEKLMAKRCSSSSSSSDQEVSSVRSPVSPAELTPERIEMRQKIRARLERELNNSPSPADLTEKLATLSISQTGIPSVKPDKKPLFTLEIVKQKQHNVYTIYNTDCATRLAKKIASECYLADEESRLVRLQIEKYQEEHGKVN